MFRVVFWPPPRGGLTRFEGLWAQLLPGPAEVLTLKATDQKARLQHNLKLVFGVNESTTVNEDAPPYPFLVHPVLYCSPFQGFGTDNINAAKHALFVQCAEFCWETARTHGLGSEAMIKHAAAALRAIDAAQSVLDVSSFPETTLPPFSSPFFASMIKSLCEFARVQKMRLPPGQLVEAELERAVSGLCYCLSEMETHEPPPTFVKWHKCFAKVLKSWTLFCVGVLLIHFKKYPYETIQEYESVADTAQRINDGLACLQLSQHPGRTSFVTEATDQLDAGYRTNIRGPSTYDTVIINPMFWREHKKGILFTAPFTNSIERTRDFFGASTPYFMSE